MSRAYARPRSKSVLQVWTPEGFKDVVPKRPRSTLSRINSRPDSLNVVLNRYMDPRLVRWVTVQLPAILFSLCREERMHRDKERRAAERRRTRVPRVSKSMTIVYALQLRTTAERWATAGPGRL